ncbi:MAG: hypothetical protein IJQ69_01205 [Bacteroidales bacterium]|nr:hypothetical protein [Bacteroidales bacterium]
MRKILLLLVLSLTVTSLSARQRMKALSPYQYGGRWYISAQVGPQMVPCEHIESFWKKGHGWEMFTPQAGVTLGCHLNDAWDLRFAGNYSFNKSALNPYKSFYSYTYRACSAFVDLGLNYNGLGEEYDRFNFKNYLGLGMAYTHRFSEVDHPFQVVEGPNLVPGFRIGAIMEVDTPGGFGFYADLGIEGFTDWYNGLEPYAFPFDMVFKVSFGLIYHFPLGRN